MGLLFRPRRPVMRLAADAAGLPPPGTERERWLAERLVRALEASVTGDVDALGELFTEDVHGSSPTIAVSSLDELTVELRGRWEALSDLALGAQASVTEEMGYAEWIVTGRHTGPLVVEDEIVVQPSGKLVTFRGVTVAEFTGDQISSFRQYWDELAFLEGLGLIPRT
jgi:ketosteroid isomerase-like protein